MSFLFLLNEVVHELIDFGSGHIALVSKTHESRSLSSESDIHNPYLRRVGETHGPFHIWRQHVCP